MNSDEVGAYRLMTNMIQLARIVPPTKQAKQKAPKRIIMRGSDLWVIPKTTEVKREKRRTAAKWLTSASFLLRENAHRLPRPRSEGPRQR